MPRAHRWSPEAVVAVSNAKTTRNNNGNGGGVDPDSSSSSPTTTATATPTVVFCPCAAKGSQNAGKNPTALTTTAAATNSRKEENEDNNNNVCNNDNHTNIDEIPASSTATGKRNPNDIVSATVFWLVDQNINRVIGRLEKEGLVSVLNDFLNVNPQTSRRLQPIHVKSHAEYRDLILANLKTEGQRNFFISEFVTNPIHEKRKFGNQAVCHETDVKCAHALVGQYLANVTCPLGELVAKFIVFLGDKADVVTTTTSVSCGEGDDDSNGEENEDDGDDVDGDDVDGSKEDHRVQSEQEIERPLETKEKDWRDNLIPLFKQFVMNTMSDDNVRDSVVTGKFIPRAQNEEQSIVTNDASIIVESAKKVVKAFLEKGEGKGRRRKRRTD